MAAPSWEAFDEISFWAQDAWSIGCILVWLVTGEDPFAGCDQEDDAGAMLHCLLQRHAALVSQLQTTPICYPNTNLETLNQCLLQRHAALVSSMAGGSIMLPKLKIVTQGPLQCYAALVSLVAHDTNMLSRYYSLNPGPVLVSSSCGTGKMNCR